jgi:chaperonin GroEL (HSP60 family)
MPLRVKDAKIALINSALEIKKTEVDASIKIEDHKMLHKFRMQEERTLKEMADKLQQVGANVVISQKGIDDLVLHYLAKAGIYGVKSASKSDVERLARAAGGKIVTNLKDLTSADLGTAGQVEERKIAEDKMTFVTGCKGARAVSILIRGGSDQVISEVDRSLHDALGVVVDVLEDGKIVPGGGACEVELSRELRNYASTVGGREQLAIEAFASAVEIVPRTLAENAGLNPIDILISLRKAHKRGQKSAGINLNTGKITDMNAENVIEPLRVIKQAIKSAADAAVMILRIDDVIAAKKTEEAKPPAGGGPGAPPGAPCGMPPEYGGMGF